MKPFIKLLHDEYRHQWICGDEDGGLLVVVDDFIEDAAIEWESKSLQKRIVRADTQHATIPITPPVRASFTGNMTFEEIEEWNDNWPDFGELTITLHTARFSGYAIRAYFSMVHMLWVVADSFEEMSSVTTT